MSKTIAFRPGPELLELLRAFGAETGLSEGQACRLIVAAHFGQDVEKAYVTERVIAVRAQLKMALGRVSKRVYNVLLEELAEPFGEIADEELEVEPTSQRRRGRRGGRG